MTLSQELLIILFSEHEIARHEILQLLACLITLPCSCLQLELVKMQQTGELMQLWNVAKQTDVQFNMVSEHEKTVISTN